MAESEHDLRAAINDSKFDRKQLPWYKPDLSLDDISDTARRLLQEYSGVAPEEVVGHVQGVVSRQTQIYIIYGGWFVLIDDDSEIALLRLCVPTNLPAGDMYNVC